MKIKEMKEMYAFCRQCDDCPRRCKYGEVCDELFNHTSKRVWAHVPDSLYKAMEELGYIDTDDVSRETYPIREKYPELITNALDSPEDAFKFWGATMYLYINGAVSEKYIDLAFHLVVPYLDEQTNFEVPEGFDKCMLNRIFGRGKDESV